MGILSNEPERSTLSQSVVAQAQAKARRPTRDATPEMSTQSSSAPILLDLSKPRPSLRENEEDEKESVEAAEPARTDQERGVCYTNTSTSKPSVDKVGVGASFPLRKVSFQIRNDTVHASAALTAKHSKGYSRRGTQSLTDKLKGTDPPVPFMTFPPPVTIPRTILKTSHANDVASRTNVTSTHATLVPVDTSSTSRETTEMSPQLIPSEKVKKTRPTNKDSATSKVKSTSASPALIIKSKTSEETTEIEKVKKTSPTNKDSTTSKVKSTSASPALIVKSKTSDETTEIEKVKKTRPTNKDSATSKVKSRSASPALIVKSKTSEETTEMPSPRGSMPPPLITPEINRIQLTENDYANPLMSVSPVLLENINISEDTITVMSSEGETIPSITDEEENHLMLPRSSPKGFSFGLKQPLFGAKDPTIPLDNNKSDFVTKESPKKDSASSSTVKESYFDQARRRSVEAAALMSSGATHSFSLARKKSIEAAAATKGGFAKSKEVISKKSGEAAEVISKKSGEAAEVISKKSGEAAARTKGGFAKSAGMLLQLRRAKELAKERAKERAEATGFKFNNNELTTPEDSPEDTRCTTPSPCVLATAV